MDAYPPIVPVQSIMSSLDPASRAASEGMSFGDNGLDRGVDTRSGESESDREDRSIRETRPKILYDSVPGVAGPKNL